MRTFADMSAPGGVVNTRNIHRVQLGSQHSTIGFHLSKENAYKDFHRKSQATFSPSTFKTAAPTAAETTLREDLFKSKTATFTTQRKDNIWSKMKARDHAMYNVSEV